MKKTRKLILRVVILAGIGLLGNASLRGQELVPSTAVNPPETKQLPFEQQSAGVSKPLLASFVAVHHDRTNELHMNFRDAPLGLVLDYLSEAAGFIINQTVEVRGNVSAWSKDPLTKEEAVKLLNSVLKKNGYGVLRDGRLLTVVSLESAKTSDLEVVSGNDPQTVEKSDEVVTQIVPIRYANAAQLINNLQVLLPSNASISSNEGANSLILVATKTDIRRMLRIIRALDNSIVTVSSTRIFPVRYADAKQLATVVQQLFTSQGSGQNTGGANNPGQFFGMPGGGPTPPGFGDASGGGSGGASGGASGAMAGKVTAVADERSNSLIVSAAPDQLGTIATMIKQIDQAFTEITEMRLFHLRNADPAELADQLAQLFPDDTKSGANQGQGPILVGGGPPGPGGGFGGPPFGGGFVQDDSTGSAHSRKKGQVLAVADARTSSLLVSAASSLMPQIAKVIDQLDAYGARKEVVKVWDLHNADPNDVNQILQSLFNRNSTMRDNTTANRNSLLGDNNPLTARQTQQLTTTASGSASGNSGSRVGSGGTDP
jgi:general secretion pathway protein D